MSKVVKFTEEEMKSLKDIQDDYLYIQSNFGQLSVAKLRLEQQLGSLETEENKFKSEFLKIQKAEQTFIDKITEKYGEGQLNPQTGEFVVIESK